jgi:hypothetical protein
MKITDVRTILLTGPCTNDPLLREARKLRSAAFIEVLTADGPIGIGETTRAIIARRRCRPSSIFSSPPRRPDRR